MNTTALPATAKLGLYEGLVHALTKIRSEKQRRMAKLIQEKSLIELLGL